MVKHCASFNNSYACSLTYPVSNIVPGPHLVLSYRGASTDVIPVIGTDLLEQTKASGTESTLWAEEAGPAPGEVQERCLMEGSSLFLR